MADCLLCEAELTAANDSEEHLLPQAIGNRKTVTGLLCEPCNNRTGSTWDADIAQQLLPFAILVRISRERGAIPSLLTTTSAGERVRIGENGKVAPAAPVFQPSAVEGGGTRYHVRARSMSEAKSIIAGLKRKHPKIDVDATLASAEVMETYLQGAVKLDLTIGGPLSGRSIVKSCVAMAFDGGIDWRACGHALRYLRDEATEPCFGYYSDRDLVADRAQGAPLHILAVNADPVSGLILAYAEYFGCHRIVSCLGEGYSGPPISASYAVDPRDGATSRPHVDLSFTRADVDDIYAYKRTDPERLKTAIGAVVVPAIQRQQREDVEEAIHRAVVKAFANCGAKPGDVLTQEQALRVGQLSAHYLAPFIAHMARRPKMEPE